MKKRKNCKIRRMRDAVRTFAEHVAALEARGYSKKEATMLAKELRGEKR